MSADANGGAASDTNAGSLPSAFPLRSDAPEALTRLRAALLDAGFTEGAVCALTGAATIYDFQTLREGREDSGPPESALAALVRLFMDGEPVDRTRVDRLLAGVWLPAAELGLLRPHPGDAARIVATTLLYPTAGLHIASDLEHDPAAPPGQRYLLPEDAVYPAITRSTQVFLSLLPDTPCDRMLDLCAGTGIAALRAASHAREAVATDVAARSVAFARFNAALNGLSNVRVHQGDAYDPVLGETFDQIVAHPPYMPALEQRLIYRDGGEDGEQVTRRIIAGLPAHLRPGGRFDCTCILTDRRDAPVEKRVRALLGDAHDDFDVLVVATQTNTPADAYTRLVNQGRLGFAEAEAYVRRFETLGVERLVGCALVVARHTARRPPVTVRRGRTPATDNAAIEWMLRWMEASTDAALPARLLDARPQLSPHARLQVLSEASGEGWRAREPSLRVDAPFAMEVAVTNETAAFLARCDGRTTVREHAAGMRDAGLLSDDADPLSLAAIVRSLAVGGFLLLDGDQPPMRTVG